MSTEVVLAGELGGVTNEAVVLFTEEANPTSNAIYPRSAFKHWMIG